MNMEKVLDGLRKTLVKRELTQKELATEMGISPAYLSDVLNGRRAISVEMAIKFAHHLQTDPMRLLTEQVRADLDRALAAQATAEEPRA